jgi:branched-chain amino acid transport system substrate-binding protein
MEILFVMVIEEIVKSIKKDIAEGKFRPDRRLPGAKELQEQFGVGRGTIREAIKILEGMGLVWIKKGRNGGVFLTDNSGQLALGSIASTFQLEESKILPFIEFRKMIEPKMTFFAASNRTDVDIKKLKAALEPLDSEAPSLELFVKATELFYNALAAATQNDYFTIFYSQTLGALTQATKLIYEIPKCVETSRYFYTQIVETIDNKEPGKGEIVSESYLVQIGDYIKNAKRLGLSIVGRKKNIKWGIIQDLSNMTVDYGKECAMGLIDAARYVNENGGINGKKLELIVHDDKYLLEEGKRIYQRFRDRHKVFGIYIQATGTNQVIASKAMQDGIFMFSGAPSAELGDPSAFPYYFCIYPTYSDMARVAIKHIRETWTNPNRNPRLVYLFPDNPYGRDPLKAAKIYAKELEVEIGPDQIINWPTIDASTQLTSMQEYNPDFAFISSTAKNAVSIFKDAHRLAIKTKFICNMRVFNEELIRLGATTVEGALGVQPIAFYGQNVPGMNKIVKAHDKWHPYHYPTLLYVEGWANVLILTVALKIADDAGKLTPGGLKKAFESFRNFNTGGLTPPISYFEHDHRATTESRIYKISDGKYIPESDSIDVGRTPRFI